MIKVLLAIILNFIIQFLKDVKKDLVIRNIKEGKDKSYKNN